MPKLSQAGVDGRVPVDGGWRMKRVGTAGCVGLMVTCVSVFGLAAETGTGVVIRTGVQEVTSSVLDGVFTAAQARRGRRVYNRDCESCHGRELEGDEMAPSIAGSEFIGFCRSVHCSRELRCLCQQMGLGGSRMRNTLTLWRICSTLIATRLAIRNCRLKRLLSMQS